MKPVVFLVSKTYAQTTSESTEHGGFDETGFVWEDVEYSFRELVDELSTGEWSQEGADWLSNGWSVIDYSEMREEEECLHIKRTGTREERYYQLALKLSGVEIR